VLPWLIGDYTGLVALGPLALFGFRALAMRMDIPLDERLFAFDDLPRLLRGSGHYAITLPALLAAVALALWAISFDPNYEPLILLVFVVIVMQFWLVHSQTVLQSMLAIALFSLTLVVMTTAFGLESIAPTLQCAMITLAAGSYFSMAVPILFADNEGLRKRLTHDSLTGAYNRHFFVDLSERAIRQSRSRGQPVSMLMIDLDNLKSINDRHGHAAGDQALSQVVRICYQSLGANDLIGRLGGDEFCAVLPGHDHIAAATAAERLIQSIRDSAYSFSSELKPSLSIGIATTHNDADDYESLWLRADSALYVAKRAGRNRIAQEESDTP
jgi:diguanylate cyclase (GGDEF)-like protein